MPAGSVLKTATPTKGVTIRAVKVIETLMACLINWFGFDPKTAKIQVRQIK